MSRWRPDARGRLEQAAYELFLAQGYDQTTVADIAERAGLTERTFSGTTRTSARCSSAAQPRCRTSCCGRSSNVPPALPTIEAVRIAVEAMSALMHGRRALARERQRIVAAHPDLQERD